MATPRLQVNLSKEVEGQTEKRFLYDLYEVEENVFMLYDKTLVKNLIDEYTEWWNQNFSISELKYQQMLELRAGLITEIKEEVQKNPTCDYGPDAEDLTKALTKQHIPKAKIHDPSDHYFIGSFDSGKLHEWSISDGKINRDFSRLINDKIYCMTITRDKEYLFVSDWPGNLKKIDLREFKVVQDYGIIHFDAVWSIATTPDNKYLFTSDGDGNLKQFSIVNEGQGHQKILVKNYGKIVDCVGILKISFDSRDIFVANFEGVLVQISIEEQKIIKHYGKIFDSDIRDMVVTMDNKYLVCASYNGEIKKISIVGQEIIKDFGQIFEDGVGSMQMLEDESLFVGTGIGELKLIETRGAKVLKDFGRVHENCVRHMILTTGKTFLYTAGGDGSVKQVNVDDRQVVKSFEKVSDGISYMCL